LQPAEPFAHSPAHAAGARPAFLITIDTEGDNLWAHPDRTTTENALFLPRFQALCEEHGLKPTYLVNYEMAMDARLVWFAKEATQAGKAEVGAHLHAWNTPPVKPLTDDDHRYHPYLTEYPEQLMAEKLAQMRQLLEDRFETRMISHRGGRWAFDARYARVLIANGFLVDCSVTPHISWRRSGAQPAGINGPDFRRFPEQPYWIDPADVSRPGASELLEVPMTIRAARRPMRRLLGRIPGVRGYLHRHRPEKRWLRPNGYNLSDMLQLCDEVRDNGHSYAMFMLHSSELMPGSSPTFESAASIERLYAHLRALFRYAQDHFRGCTLGEFRQQFGKTEQSAEAISLPSANGSP
jgi:hypothetical protein